MPYYVYSKNSTYQIILWRLSLPFPLALSVWHFTKFLHWEKIRRERESCYTNYYKLIYMEIRYNIASSNCDSRSRKHWSINPQITIWITTSRVSFHTLDITRLRCLKLLQAQRNGSHLDPISRELDIAARGLTVLLSINRRNHRIILTSADAIWNSRRDTIRPLMGVIGTLGSCSISIIVIIFSK